MSEVSAGFYRAALSAAQMGDLTLAARLAQYSLAMGEDAPNAPQLLKLLHSRAGTDDDDAFGGASDKLRTLIAKRRYKKALLLPLPHTVAAHNARGLLYALLGRNGRAVCEFALALSMDAGNDLAKRGIVQCGDQAARRRGLWNLFQR